MAWFGSKKKEEKKIDYSDETMELFAERDAFYDEQRRKLGGETSNPELANQPNSEESKPKTEDLEDLLGGSEEFNPYVDKEQSGPETSSGVPASSPSSSGSPNFVCTSCSKTFQEKWGKCPSCGGSMEKAGSAAPPETTPTQSSPPSTPDTNVGDPLDDLLGDFSSSDSLPPSPEETPDDSGVKMAGDDDLSTDFGQSSSSHSNRKRVRKVKKVKRPRKSP